MRNMSSRNHFLPRPDAPPQHRCICAAQLFPSNTSWCIGGDTEVLLPHTWLKRGQRILLTIPTVAHYAGARSATASHMFRAVQLRPFLNNTYLSALPLRVSQRFEKHKEGVREKRQSRHTTSGAALTEEPLWTSVDAFPNGCVFARDRRQTVSKKDSWGERCQSVNLPLSATTADPSSSFSSCSWKPPAGRPRGLREGGRGRTSC